ncbi:MAG: hypothetical protein HY265_06350 [Deltaproteobacteria bacterium]|nr:hypothetical protein [Deltaproteobacteria bacterium]
MDSFLLLLILGTALWVLFDAQTIGVKKGQIQGFGNVGGPWSWFFMTILLWIVIFPLYLAKRGEFKRVNNKAGVELKNLFFLLVIFLCVGCTQKAPSCGDDKTKELVLSISQNGLKKQCKGIATGLRKDQVDMINRNCDDLLNNIPISIKNITIKDFNEKIGSYQCAGTLVLTFSKGKGNQITEEEQQITYTSELSADKEGGFVVGVYGLKF